MKMPVSMAAKFAALDPLLEPLRARWRALAPRERRALRVLSAFFGVVLFYVLVWSPVQSNLTRLRAQLPAEQSRLARMREQSALVANLRRSQPANSSVDPLSAAQQAAERLGLRDKMKRIEADGARGVRVEIEGASFNAVTGWLTELQRQSGLRAENAVFEKQSTPGTVTARITLRSSGT